MSARLGLNPIPYTSWKGLTLNQVTATIHKNGPVRTDHVSFAEFMRSRPIKHYRRELLTTPAPGSRSSVTIAELDRPNGGIVTPADRCAQGVVSTVDMTITTSKYDNGMCTDPAVCREQNARRRVRSAGMNKPRYDVSKTFNPLIYCSDTKQYLATRNKTFEQNSYHYLRRGDASMMNTGVGSNVNMYSPAGLLTCPKAYIGPNANQNFLQYVWVNPIFIDNGHNEPFLYDIHIPTGYYTIEELNRALHEGMAANTHYLKDTLTGTRVFFMNFVYNNYHNKVELQCLPISLDLYPSPRYVVPTPAPENIEDLWTIPTEPTSSSRIPVLVVSDNAFSDILGLDAGYYPNIKPWLDIDGNIQPLDFPIHDDGDVVTVCPNIRTTPYTILSNKQHHVFPMYKSVSYKPNNSKFAQNGGVSSSDRTLRTKYDMVSSNGSSYVKPYGNDVANAMSYGVSNNPYTAKDKMYIPVKSTPVVCPGTTDQMGEMRVSRRKNMYNG